MLSSDHGKAWHLVSGQLFNIKSRLPSTTCTIKRIKPQFRSYKNTSASFSTFSGTRLHLPLRSGIGERHQKTSTSCASKPCVTFAAESWTMRQVSFHVLTTYYRNNQSLKFIQIAPFMFKRPLVLPFGATRVWDLTRVILDFHNGPRALWLTICRNRSLLFVLPRRVCLLVGVIQMVADLETVQHSCLRLPQMN